MVQLKIREIRKRRGWAQQQLADASGVARLTIGDIELGKQHPTTRTLEKIACAFGVSVTDLMKEPALVEKAEALPRGQSEDPNDWLLSLLRYAEVAYHPEGIMLRWSEEMFEWAIRRIGETALRAAVIDLGVGNQERAIEILQVWARATTNLEARKALLEEPTKAPERQARIRRDLAEPETLERQLAAYGLAAYGVA